jgi:hypothetical protein
MGQNPEVEMSLGSHSESETNQKDNTIAQQPKRTELVQRLRRHSKRCDGEEKRSGENQ